MDDARADRMRRRIARNHGIDISERLAADGGEANERTVLDAFAAIVRRFGHRPAVRSRGRELSYRQLDDESSRLAASIVARIGADPRPVGVLLERSADMIVAALASVKTGACYVPLEPAMPAARLAMIIEDAAPSAVVTSPDLRDMVPDGVPVLMAGDHESAGWQPPPVAGSARAYVVFTSGTTGRPKGVQVSHANLLHLLASTRQVFDFGPADVWTMFHSFGFDFAIWETWGPLLSGGCVVVVPHEVARDPAEFRRLLRDERVTVINQTPKAFSQLAEEDRRHPDRLALSRVLLGGEALRFADLRPWMDKYGDVTPRLANIYGPSEGTVIASYYPLSRGDLYENRSLIGRPLPGLEFVLVDQDLAPVPPGALGEIVITGPSVAIGYIARDELTRERFVEVAHPHGHLTRGYRTGDLAVLTAEAEFEFRGRNDDQVKIRGYRVEPGEVEAVLCSLADVTAAAVVPRDLPDLGLSLVAYVVPAAGQDAAPARLRDTLGALLPEYMVPRSFVLMERLPLTPHGKLDRRALPEPDLALGDAADAARSPRDVEARVIGIVRALLHTADVTPESNFFALGGHSLLATKLLARVRSDLGADVPLRAFFQEPTSRALAAAVRRELSAENPPGLRPILGSIDIIPAPDPENPPLTAAQKRMYFIAQLDPHSCAYHLHTTLLLEGALDISALERAFAAVLARHVPLRTVVRVADGEPLGQVQAVTGFRLPVEELGGPPSHWQQRLTQLAEAESAEPFDLHRDAMLRARLFVVGLNRHALMVTMHHMSADGWSVAVLSHELQAFYRKYTADPGDSSLPSPRYGYADFAYAVNQWSASASAGKDIGYWMDRLAGLPETPMIATDRPRPSRISYRGASLDVIAEGVAADALRGVCREQNVTMFMFMRAALGVFLSRRGSGTDVIFGTAVANRPLAELNELIGMFVNTMVCRVTLREDETFQDLLERGREETLGDLEHQHVPFDMVVKHVNPRRSTDAMPLFQVMLVVQNNESMTLDLEGLNVTRFTLLDSTAKVDLLVEVLEHERDIQFRWTYNTDLFSHETVAEIAGGFDQLLASLTASAGALSRRLDLTGTRPLFISAPQRRGSRRSSILLPLRSAPNGPPPVITLPGGLGLGSAFAQIAAHINRGLASLQFRDLVEPEGAGLTAGSFIDSCARIIMESVDGPIHLAGHSIGGTMAFYLVGSLRRRGQAVLSLTMLDSPAVTGLDELLAGSRTDHLWSFLGSLAEAFPDAASGWRENGLGQISSEDEATILSRVEGLLGVDRLDLFDGSLSRAFAAYLAMRELRWPAAEPLDCPALLLRATRGGHATSAAPTLGWRHVLRELTVEDVPASHEDIIRQPYAEMVTARMERFLVDAESLVHG